MAVTLINLSGYQYGVEAEETALNVKSFESAYKPEFKEWLMNKSNEKIGFALAPTEVDISLEGEVKGAISMTFASAVTLGNDSAEFGASGAVYMDEATVKQSRDGWRTFTGKFSKVAGVAGS